MINSTRKNKFYESLIMILGLNFILLSCASYTKLIPEQPNIQSSLEKGDTVKIHTKDGREVEFKITEISSDELIGESERVNFDEISQLELMTASAKDNTFEAGKYTLTGILYIGALLIGSGL